MAGRSFGGGLPAFDRDHEVDPAGAETELEGGRVQENGIARPDLAAEIRVRDGRRGYPIHLDLQLLCPGTCRRHGADDTSSDADHTVLRSRITAPI